VLDKLIQVQEKINGEESERFKTEGLGQYFTGDVALIFGEQTFTLSFQRGTITEVFQGSPLTGVDFSVAGPEEGWQELYVHKNFYRAIAPEKGKLHLQGNMVKAMGNLNCLGYLAKVLCTVV
jgi:hypothetical protein